MYRMVLSSIKPGQSPSIREEMGSVWLQHLDVRMELELAEGFVRSLD
jgi:hypothetical protein